MLKLALLFQDHMVVQSEKNVTVWGTADPSETVPETGMADYPYLSGI